MQDEKDVDESFGDSAALEVPEGNLTSSLNITNHPFSSVTDRHNLFKCTSVNGARHVSKRWSYR